MAKKKAAPKARPTTAKTKRRIKQVGFTTIDGKDIHFWFSRGRELQRAIVANLPMQATPVDATAHDEVIDAEIEVGTSFYVDTVREAGETLRRNATLINYLRSEVKHRVGPIDKVQSQRIMSGLLLMADTLRELRPDMLPERMALNLTLAKDYVELAKMFMPDATMADGLKKYAESVERAQIRNDAERRAQEVGRNDTRLALAK